MDLIRNLAGYSEDDWGLPQATEAGIRCGNHPRDLGIRHECVAAVQACYAIMAELEAQQRGEIYAEAGMSWVAGGGSQADASRYASWVVSNPGKAWNGGI